MFPNEGVVRTQMLTSLFTVNSKCCETYLTCTILSALDKHKVPALRSQPQFGDDTSKVPQIKEPSRPLLRLHKR